MLCLTYLISLIFFAYILVTVLTDRTNMNLFFQGKAFSSRRCLHFEVVGGLEWSNDPESYAGGSVATDRASLAGKVKGDDSD